MGQAMKKLENIYENHRNSIEIPHVYNNQDNDDYDYLKIIKAKSNALKLYLTRNNIENIEEVNDVTLHLVEKVENKFLSIEEASKYLNCNPRTIRNRINKDGMPYVMDGNKKLVSIENLDLWKNGKPDSIENTIETVDNSNVEEYIPMPIENYVTKDELNSYTLALKDFTEAINLIREEVSEIKTAQIAIQEEKLLERIKELNEKLEEIKQKKIPFYKKWKKLLFKN